MRNSGLHFVSGLRERLRASAFVRHGTLVFAGVMLANVFSYAYYALVGRIVAVEEYGVVSALFSATLLIATAPATVAATIVARIAADFAAQGARAKLRRLVSLSFRIAWGAGSLAFFVVAVARDAIANVFHLRDSSAVLAAACVLGLSFVLPVARAVFQGSQHFREFTSALIIESIGRAIAGPVLALRFGATGALIGLAFGTALGICYVAIAASRIYVAPAERLLLDVRGILRSSLATGSAILAINFLLFYDVIFVRNGFSGVTAGLYGAAALVGRALYTIVSVLPTVVLPKASALAAAGEDARPMLFVALGLSVSAIVCALAFTLVAPGFLVALLAGQRFIAAGAYVPAYTIALGLLALTNVTATYNIALKRFSFVVPLAVVAIIEVVVVLAWHPDVERVIDVLAIGHGCAFVVTLIDAIRPWSPRGESAAIIGNLSIE